jgi:hypothetical protein
MDLRSPLQRIINFYVGYEQRHIHRGTWLSQQISHCADLSQKSSLSDRCGDFQAEGYWALSVAVYVMQGAQKQSLTKKCLSSGSPVPNTTSLHLNGNPFLFALLLTHIVVAGAVARLPLYLSTAPESEYRQKF